MRSTVTSRLSKALSSLCAALLCISLFPTTALASQTSLSLIPEGDEGAVRIASGAEGGALDTFSHCASDGVPSADADGAVTSSGTVEDTEESSSAPEDDLRISEDMPLESDVRGFVEVEFMDGFDEGAVRDEGAFEGETENEVEPGFEMEERALYGEAATHNVYFEANGGDYVPAGFYTASVGGEMPDISSALLANPPYRYGCTFLGFYDGSDPTRAKKYYNKDFRVDDTCDGKRYPADAEGLTLYAGFAPILKVDVPGSVSIAVGTVPEIAGPTVAPLQIANESVWPVEFTSLAWETEGQNADMVVTEADVLAASQFVSGILAKEVMLAPSTISEMFTTPETLSLVISTPDGNEVRVPYGGAGIELPKGEANPLKLAAAPTLPSESAGASALPLNVTIDMGSSAVKNAEKVSKTRLLSSYRASSWDAAPQSYVMFDLRGGEGGQVDSLPATYGEALLALGVTSEPTLEGHIFLGYYDDDDTCWYAPDGAGAVIPVTGKMWDKSSAAVLHAEWRTRDCTVELVAGPEGSSAQVERGQRVVTRNVAYNEPLSSVFGRALPTPQWIVDGQRYTFDGWYLADGTEATVDTVITDYAGKTTLTAHWLGVPVTVTWNTEAEGVTVDAWTDHPSGTELGELPVPVRPGYTFAGWYTRSGGEGVQATEKTVIFEDAAFYAKWSANTIVVTFELDGVAYTATAPYSPTAKLPIPAGLPANPAKAGYDFLGWYEVLDDGALAANPLNLQVSHDLPSQDVTYRGKWAGKTIELSWNAGANGGAWTGAAVTTQTYEDGAVVAVPEGTPTKTGFGFIGWWTAPDGGARVDVAEGYPLPVENATFYARFVDRPTTISFDLGGGSWNMPVGVTVKASVDKDMPAIMSGGTAATVPAKEGYDFEGFYLDDVCYYGGNLASVQQWVLGDEAVKLTAKWTPWMRTVVFAANGGENPDQAGEVSWDAPVNFATTEPVHANGSFLGWSLRADALRADAPDAVTTYTLAQFKELCDSAGTAFPTEGETLTVYAIYQLPMHPKDSLDELGEGGDDFYLELTEDDVKKDDRIPDDAYGFYGLGDIEHAANDIAENKESSAYYDLFEALMDNDLQFTTAWKYFEYDNDATPIKRLETTAKDENGQDKTIPYKVRIIGLLHDDPSTVKSVDGATIDKAGITFQFVDLLYNTYQMNEAIGATNWNTTPDRGKYPFNYILYDGTASNNTNANGWAHSELRANMNPGIDVDLLPNNVDTDAVWSLVPANLQNAIVPVEKKYYAGMNAVTVGGSPSISSDLLFIASYSELVASDYISGWGNLANEGSTYQFYRSNGVTGNAHALKMPGDPNGGASADTAYASNKCLLKYHILPASDPLSGGVNGAIDKRILKTYYGNGADYDGWTSGYQWEWWGRSSSPASAMGYTMVNASGTVHYGNYSSSFRGVSPAFCMGSGVQVGDEVTITYDAGDGAFADGSSKKTVTSVYGQPLAKLDASDVPTREGYTFEGWGNLPTTTPRGNTTYYARWAGKSCALIFDLGSGRGTSPTGLKAVYGQAMPAFPDGAGKPFRHGHTLLGFYDSPSGGTQYYTADLTSARSWDQVPDETGTIVLYAHWEASANIPSPDTPQDGDYDFYLYLTAADAAKVSTPSLTMGEGYYAADQIKEAARDIAEHGTSSPYYAVYKAIMDNDIKFWTRWKDVDSHNATTVLDSTTYYNVRLIGLRQDYTDTVKTTYAGMTFQFADNGLTYGYRYNNQNYNSIGWQHSEIRARMNSTNAVDCSPQPAGSISDPAVRQSIWNRAPSAVTSNIQPVYKFTHNAAGNTPTAVTATRDQMFLASYWEMSSINSAYSTSSYSWIFNETVSGTQYQYWKAKNVSGNVANASMVKYGKPSAASPWTAYCWWERSCHPGETRYFLRVFSNGTPSYGGANSGSNDMVVPCFCF